MPRNIASVRGVATGRGIASGRGIALSRGLITNLGGWWEMDEVSSNRANSLPNGPKLIDVNSVGSALGCDGIGNAADFVAASSQYLRCGNTAALSPNGAIPFTVVFFLRETTISTQRHIYQGNGLSAAVDEYSVFTLSNRIQMRISNGAGYTTLVYGIVNPILINTWYFVAAWRDVVNNVIGVRLNALASATASFPGSSNVPNTGSEFTVGALNANGARSDFTNGRIDKAGFWKNRLLTSAELDFLYNSGNGRSYAEL